MRVNVPPMSVGSQHRFFPRTTVVRRFGHLLLVLVWAAASACSDGETSPEPVESFFFPPDAPAREGNAQNYSPFSGPARRFQTLYRPSVLIGVPVGAQITGMRFRLDHLAGPIEGEIANFEVRLSTFPRPLQALDPEFAQNRGLNEVVVRTGPLVVAQGDYPVGGSPNAFGPVIEFQQPFTYPGGPLLLEIGMTGISMGSTVDGVIPVDGVVSAYGSENGFDTTTADQGIFSDLIVVEYLFVRP